MGVIPKIIGHARPEHFLALQEFRIDGERPSGRSFYIRYEYLMQELQGQSDSEFSFVYFQIISQSLWPPPSKLFKIFGNRGDIPKACVCVESCNEAGHERRHAMRFKAFCQLLVGHMRYGDRLAKDLGGEGRDFLSAERLRASDIQRLTRR